MPHLAAGRARSIPAWAVAQGERSPEQPSAPKVFRRGRPAGDRLLRTTHGTVGVNRCWAAAATLSAPADGGGHPRPAPAVGRFRGRHPDPRVPPKPGASGRAHHGAPATSSIASSSPPWHDRKPVSYTHLTLPTNR